jgi:hypothetical protein
MKQLVTLSHVLLIGATVLLVPSSPAPAAPHCRAGAKAMVRVDLYFGAGLKDGAMIDDAAWRAFLAEEITPRFPEGLTVTTGEGQWREKSGAILKETSRVVTIWYRASSTASARVDAIRTAYKVRFKQASVLRADSAGCVAF